MKKAIHEIAAEILAQKHSPMTAEEIYEVIVSQKLYEFKTQNPKSVLRNQLRRHSANVKGANQATKPLFNMSEDSKFSLIP